MKTWRKVSHGHGEWITEAYFDWTCLMVGVNWAPGGSGRIRGIYAHIGPLILGVWRWE